MNKPTLVLAAVAATIGATLPASAAPATTAAAPAPHRPDTSLTQDAQRLLRLGAPGVLAQVDTPSGQVEVRAGYGDVARRTPVPWDARFRIGSMTKPFVATVMLQLVGEGKVSLDASVEHYLPGLVHGHGNDGRRITVRELLQHTSGLPDYAAYLPFTTVTQFRQHRFDTVTARDAVRLAVRHRPEFAPGTRWSYSNTNYALAGLIIHAVTGHSWRDEVRHRVIDRLHLKHTTIPRTDPRIPGPHAIGYERFLLPGSTSSDPHFSKPIDATVQNPSWGGAAGAVISTPDDANTFLRALVQGRLLPPRQLEQMQTTVPTDARFQQEWPGSRYGLGLMWIPNSCGGSWAHGGDIQGYLTRNGVTPDGKRAVTVTVNTDSPVPAKGVPASKHDPARALIDHALCGSPASSR